MDGFPKPKKEKINKKSKINIVWPTKKLNVWCKREKWGTGNSGFTCTLVF